MNNKVRCDVQYLSFRHGVQYPSAVPQPVDLTTSPRCGPHLRPSLIRHISLTRMREEGQKVLINPCLKQYQATSNGLATNPRRHSQLSIHVGQRHRTPGNLILIDVDG